MFNEKQKGEYLQTDAAKRNSAQVVRSIKSLFDDIEWYERECGTDICNTAPMKYPDIILQSRDVGRLSYLSNLNRMLLYYRDYCLAKGFVDDEAFLSQKTLPPKLSNRELMDKLIAYKAKNPTAEIKTPQKLYSLLENVFKSVNYYDETTKTVTYDALYMLMYMLTFFGIDTCDLTLLKRGDVRIDGDTGVITYKGNPYVITGESVEVLRHYLNAVVMENVRQRRTITKQIGVEYLFMTADNSDHALGYRRHYQSMQSAINNSDVEVPKLVDISFRGHIYKMCVAAQKNVEQDSGYMPLKLTDDEIIKLYEESNYIQNTRPMNFQQRYEIICEFKNTYEYIESNNMW